MDDPLQAIVSLELHVKADSSFALPGSGSRSMLFVFEGRQIGATAASKSGDFVAGSRHPSVSLTFWAREAVDMVVPTATFDVWLGGTIGSGVVQSVSWQGRR